MSGGYYGKLVLFYGLTKKMKFDRTEFLAAKRLGCKVSIEKEFNLPDETDGLLTLRVDSLVTLST